MKAVVLNRETENKIELKDLTLQALGEEEVRIQIKAAALNHRDEWARQGLYPNLKDGAVFGSDGAGVVVEVGENVDKAWIGKDVVINPAMDWGNDPKVQSKAFHILGIPSNGTLAEFVQVKADRIHLKPSHMSWEEAAALPLAGLTAFRALMVQGRLQPGEKVLVTGFGGGVAQFAAQFASAHGAEVYVSSSSMEKIKSAISHGIKAGFNYRDEDWAMQAIGEVGGFDLVIDSAMGSTLDNLIQVLNPGGRLVFYGATKGNPMGFNARKVYWNQLSIIGSTMGTDEDFERMLDFVIAKKITPVIDQVFELNDALEAFERMKQGLQLGKIVIRI